LALYPNNGSLKWSFSPYDCTWTTPIIGPDGTVYIGSTRGNFFAINSNGTERWRSPISAGFWFGGSAALSLDNTLYFGTTSFMGGTPAFYAINASTGQEKWRYMRGGDYESTPAIGSDGTVYAASTSGLFAFGPGGKLKAEAYGPYKGYYNESITFKSDAFGGTLPYTYRWDFGDGNYSEEEDVSYSYKQNGSFTVTVTATDGTGNISIDNTVVTINYRKPVTEVINPSGTGVYLSGKKILPFIPFRNCFVLGPITVEIKVYNHYLEIDRVEFSVDGNYVASDNTEPYTWRLETMKYLGKHRVSFLAYANMGQVSNYNYIDIIKII